MRYWRKGFGIILAATILVVGNSCGSSGNKFGPPVNSRAVFVIPYDQFGSEITQLPMTGNMVYAMLRVSPKSGETHELNDLIRKFEVNFGDGTGWFDVTEFTTVTGSSRPQLHNMFSHSYTAPGTYHINARGTYWDGEVVYSRPDQVRTVIVTEIAGT